MVESKFVDQQITSSTGSSSTGGSYNDKVILDKDKNKVMVEDSDRTKLKKGLRQMYFPGKRIFNTSLFIIGLAFIANAILLYVDTLTSILHADIFFGFSRQGRNDHLQRSSAILGFIVGFMNLYTASIEKNKMLTGYTLFADFISISHYIVETFYFKSIRYEYTALVTVFLLFNFIWGVRNYYYELRLVQEENINERTEQRQQPLPSTVQVHED